MQWLALTVAIAIATAVRVRTKTFAHPAALFTAYWAVLLFLLTVVFRSLYPAPHAAWFIVVAMAGVTITLRVDVNRGEVRKTKIVVPKWVTWFVLFAAVCTVVATIVAQVANGVLPQGFWTFDSLARSARAITRLRYEGGLESPALSTLLLGLGYAGATLAPFAAPNFENSTLRRFTLISPAMAAGYYAIATTARAPFLVAAVLTASGWMLNWATSAGGKPTVKKAQALVLIVVGAAVLLTFVFAAFIRVGRTDGQAQSLVTARIGIYTTGSIVALEKGLGSPSPMYLGKYSLQGILSVVDRQDPVYSSRLKSTSVGPGMASNVYTGFWSGFLDFGPIGAILGTVLLAFAGAWGIRVAVLRESLIGAMIYVAWVAALLFSQTTNIYYFTNVIFGLGVAAILVVRFGRFSEAVTTPTRGRTAIRPPGRFLAKLNFGKNRSGEKSAVNPGPNSEPQDDDEAHVFRQETHFRLGGAQLIPRTSIIMPVHNAALTVSRSIESVLAQTDENWELVIVDDGSDDDSWEVISSYASSDSRIRASRSSKSAGAAAARNSAISRSVGRFIAFLDADDLWAPQKLDRQISHMEEHEVALSYTAYAKIDFGDLECDGSAVPTKRIVWVPGSLEYRDMLRQNYIGCLTAIYDRQRIGTVYMPNIRLRQDYALWLSILRNGLAAKGINEPLATYRTSGRGSLSGNKIRAALYTWRVYRDLEGMSRLRATRCFMSYAGLSSRRSLI